MSIELYVTDDGVHGAELWRVDTVTGATSLVDDINPLDNSSTPGSNIGDIVVSNGAAYFSAFNGVSTQLWRSDGTTSGTYAVSEPIGDQAIENLTNVDGVIYFTGSNASQSGIFKSDGTANGTALVSNLSAFHLTALDGKLLFETYDPNNGGEFWSTDGTAAGTVPLMTNLKFWGSNYDVRNETMLGNNMFYTADDGVDGVQIWETDGTRAGTHMLTHFSSTIRPNALYDTSPVGNLDAFNGSLYFVADPSGGSSPGSAELVSLSGDGTSQTVLGTGNQYSLETQFFNLNNVLLFESLGANGSGFNIYSSDGSSAGTALVTSGVQGASFVSGVVAGSNFFFATMDQNGRGTLWVTDGTAAGTHIVQDFTSSADHGYIYSLTTVGSQVIFNATDVVNGDQFWISDGTTAGTHVLVAGNAANGSYPYNFTSLSLTFVGSSGTQIFNGGAGDDLFIAGVGNDTFNGDGGVDTAVVNETLASVKLSYANGIYTINGPKGTDTLNGVEIVQFSDQTINLATHIATTSEVVAADGSSTLSGFALDGQLIFANYYNSAGVLFEEAGYDGYGNRIAEVDIAGDGSQIDRTFTASGIMTALQAFNASGQPLYANYYNYSGRLFEQDGFDSNGLKSVEIDTAADGSFTSDFFLAGVLRGVRGYSANDVETYANYYDATGRLFEQDGFDANGVKTTEIDTSVDGSRTQVTFFNGAVHGVVGYGSNGVETYANYYDATGRLFEQDGFDVNGLKSVEIDTAADGSQATITFFNGVLHGVMGHNANGVETYANYYDATGRLFEQDGFDSSGLKAVEIDTAADGSRVVSNFASGALSNQTGYSGADIPTYRNVYVNSILVEQDGFNAAGTKITEIDHLGDGSTLTSHFDSSAALTDQTELDPSGGPAFTLVRTPSSGAYTLNGLESGVSLMAISGAGVIDISGASIAVSVASGFGSAAVNGFVATGAGHDLIHVDHTLAVDYAHLIADAQDVGGDTVITFNPHDSLTLHSIQIAQLSLSDFLFA